MHVVHLIASGFFGGPERQILGLCGELAPGARSTILLFSESGRGRDFRRHALAAGIEAKQLVADTPRVLTAAREIAGELTGATALFCHGYKAALIGRPAARRAGVAAVAVSRGWTSENWKVRAYTAADRAHLRCMDHVVAVSEGQAWKCRRAGVARNRLTVIPNSARLEAFAGPADPAARAELLRHFPGYKPSRVVLAAGRFSPEKGFDLLVDAAAIALRNDPGAAVVLYGDGDLRPALEAARQAARPRRPIRPARVLDPPRRADCRRRCRGAIEPFRGVAERAARSERGGRAGGGDAGRWCPRSH